MDPSSLEKLTKRQKECLRLLYQHHNAKQIGRKLKISPNTVDRHFQDARSLVGVSRSKDLAILLAKHEGGNGITTEPAIIESLPKVEDHGQAVALDPSDVPARNRSHLEGLPKLVLIVATAFLAVAVLGSVRAILDDLMHFFWNYQIDISDEPYGQ